MIYVLGSPYAVMDRDAAWKLDGNTIKASIKFLQSFPEDAIIHFVPDEDGVDTDMMILRAIKR